MNSQNKRRGNKPLYLRNIHEIHPIDFLRTRTGVSPIKQIAQRIDRFEASLMPARAIEPTVDAAVAGGAVASYRNQPYSDGVDINQWYRDLGRNLAQAASFVYQSNGASQRLLPELMAAFEAHGARNQFSWLGSLTDTFKKNRDLLRDVSPRELASWFDYQYHLYTEDDYAKYRYKLSRLRKEYGNDTVKYLVNEITQHTDELATHRASLDWFRFAAEQKRTIEELCNRRSEDLDRVLHNITDRYLHGVDRKLRKKLARSSRRLSRRVGSDMGVNTLQTIQESLDNMVGSLEKLESGARDEHDEARADNVVCNLAECIGVELKIDSKLRSVADSGADTYLLRSRYCLTESPEGYGMYMSSPSAFSSWLARWGMRRTAELDPHVAASFLVGRHGMAYGEAKAMVSNGHLLTNYISTNCAALDELADEMNENYAVAETELLALRRTAVMIDYYKSTDYADLISNEHDFWQLLELSEKLNKPNINLRKLLNQYKGVVEKLYGVQIASLDWILKSWDLRHLKDADKLKDFAPRVRKLAERFGTPVTLEQMASYNKLQTIKEQAIESDIDGLLARLHKHEQREMHKLIDDAIVNHDYKKRCTYDICTEYCSKMVELIDVQLAQPKEKTDVKYLTNAKRVYSQLIPHIQKLKDINYLHESEARRYLELREIFDAFSDNGNWDGENDSMQRYKEHLVSNVRECAIDLVETYHQALRQLREATGLPAKWVVLLADDTEQKSTILVGNSREKVAVVSEPPHYECIRPMLELTKHL